jgi:hypothetical protein
VLSRKIAFSYAGFAGALAALLLLDRSPGYASVAAPCQRPALLGESDRESPTQDTLLGVFSSARPRPTQGTAALEGT